MPYTIEIANELILSEDSSGDRAQLITLSVPSVSTGEARPLRGWYFDRDQAMRGKKLAPTRSETLTDGSKRHTYALDEGKYYLADGCVGGERRFAYILVSRGGVIEELEREQVAEAMYQLQGVDELREALAEHDWARAWERMHYAKNEDALLAKEELVQALKDALAAIDEPELEGRPTQVDWANRLRARAIGRLRGLYRNFTVNPALPQAHPRLHYALLTCAYNLKTEARAKLFVAMDFHIERGDIAEIVDRFASNGSKRYKPRGRAECLTRQDLDLLRRLTT